MTPKPFPLAAFAAALALAGCNQAPETTDNAAVDVGNAAEPGNAAFDEAPLVENAEDAGTAAVTVAAVPRPAAGTPAADAGSLNDAATIEEAIRTGRGIQRVRYGEGWAWTRGGKIIRTADRDGRDVAYFHDGDDKPFFVQRGERSYAYRDGKPVREFDRDGRGRAPDADRAREANEAAERARQQRSRAEQAREHARPGNGNDRGDRRPDRPQASPAATPSPTPSPSPTARGPRDRDRDGGGNRSGGEQGRDRDRGGRDHN